MHDYIATEILRVQQEQLLIARYSLETQLEQTRLLRTISKSLQHANPHNVISGLISQGDIMSNTSGSMHTFTVTPEPASATIDAAASVWTSSDETNAPVTVDTTGLIGTVNIAADAPVGTAFVITWTYTNADGTTATASVSETVVEAVVDVTGGTIEETA